MMRARDQADKGFRQQRRRDTSAVCIDVSQVMKKLPFVRSVFGVSSGDNDDSLEPADGWLDLLKGAVRVMQMSGSQKINHFPGMHVICRKGDLARSLGRMQREHPKDYRFFPRTWVLPSDLADFKDEVMASNASRKPGDRGPQTRHGHHSDADMHVMKKSRRRKARTYYIIKPIGGCQGKGIYLTSGWKRASWAHQEPAVAQRYVTNPLLIDGFKFDLRVYVLVTSCDPLRVMLHRRGIVRLCTHKYHPPRRRNLRNTRMHLTNYAVNKGSDAYIPPGSAAPHFPVPQQLPVGPRSAGDGSASDTTEHGPPEFAARSNGSHNGSASSAPHRQHKGVQAWRENNARSTGGNSRRTASTPMPGTTALEGRSAPGLENGRTKTVNAANETGSKRNLEWFFVWLENEGGDASALWREVAGLVVKTLATAQPSLAKAYRACLFGSTPKQEGQHSHSRCFELLGYDVLIDDNRRPWLLEVNHSPSFARDTSLDDSVKREVISDTMRVVNMRPGEHRRHQEQEAARSKRRLYGTCGHSSDGGGSARRREQRHSGYSAKRAAGSEKATAPSSNETSGQNEPKTSAAGPSRADGDSRMGGFELIHPPHEGEDSDRGRSFADILRTSQALLDRTTGAGAAFGGRCGSNAPNNGIYHQPDRLYDESGSSSQQEPWELNGDGDSGLRAREAMPARDDAGKLPERASLSWATAVERGSPSLRRRTAGDLAASKDQHRQYLDNPRRSRSSGCHFRRPGLPENDRMSMNATQPSRPTHLCVALAAESRNLYSVVHPSTADSQRRKQHRPSLATRWERAGTARVVNAGALEKRPPSPAVVSRIRGRDDMDEVPATPQSRRVQVGLQKTARATTAVSQRTSDSTAASAAAASLVWNICRRRSHTTATAVVQANTTTAVLNGNTAVLKNGTGPSALTSTVHRTAVPTPESDNSAVTLASPPPNRRVIRVDRDVKDAPKIPRKTSKAVSVAKTPAPAVRRRTPSRPKPSLGPEQTRKGWSASESETTVARNGNDRAASSYDGVARPSFQEYLGSGRPVPATEDQDVGDGINHGTVALLDRRHRVLSARWRVRGQRSLVHQEAPTIANAPISDAVPTQMRPRSWSARGKTARKPSPPKRVSIDMLKRYYVSCGRSARQDRDGRGEPMMRRNAPG